MLQVPGVPLPYQTPANPRSGRAKETPVSGGIWYRLDIDGESPLVGGLVWLGVSDDLAARGATLRVELSLPLWTPEGFKYLELHATARELGAKKAKRWFKAWVKRQD